MEAMNGIPPQIPGYTFAQKLGSGSEANVYLYQQLSPSRQVAIKVSKGTLDPRAAARFRSEANFMGRISSHPYILSVYESGVTATGNGYTVFEYAPGGNYKTFLESNRLNADQMLTVGINLASALSTAHREGIIPALESAHAIAEAVKRAPQMSSEQILVICLSGRGDKDVLTIQEALEERIEGGNQS